MNILTCIFLQSHTHVFLTDVILGVGALGQEVHVYVSARVCRSATLLCPMCKASSSSCSGGYVAGLVSMSLMNNAVQIL